MNNKNEIEKLMLDDEIKIMLKLIILEILLKNGLIIKCEARAYLNFENKQK